VDKECARTIAEATRDAEAALTAAVETLRATVSDRAADTCHAELVRLSVDVGLMLLSPLYEEYPELAPEVPAGDSDFDPLGFRIPAAELKPVLHALSTLRRVMDDALQLVEKGAATPGEKFGYLNTLATVRDGIQEATSRLAQFSDPEADVGTKR
jgi:hypothetical protein